MSRKHLLLLFWLVGILFPMALFTRYSATYNRWFQTVFTPEWTHVVMHAFLYAVLAVLLARTLPPRFCHPFWLLTLVLLVACLQEGVQLIYTASLPGRDELFDIGVDLIGGSVGVLLAQKRLPLLE
ncbi:hypothetical protein ARMA_0608 [Ardenticatena maritima]|uniref:VanZ-like domain-containing protein n=1 Tax=Ardenticatena maritima TaxID=872965 RepID=A0A0M8K5L6_9CHLR|nr:hypothetical protein [Ardenticatena maritima]KPL87595.1 hypothetical protein SE16_08105 [Ardenticatena maritima]GAP62185.1 hypothetical protein ARMA_0608 [Ardenticatena maritima]